MALTRRALLRLGATGFRLSQCRHFSAATSDAASPQIYISMDRDPYVNLSIEHNLLQTSHPDSTILFLCRNHPCVVIGRNQNPWLETNLRLLRHGIPESSRDPAPARGSDPVSITGAPSGGPAPLSSPRTTPHRPVSLVRRRSGGGAVFHDEGNANWTVICPPAVFDRDRHAEMVVRALGRLGVTGVRVNGRHDIVQDVAETEAETGNGEGKATGTFKVSGSAYKLTRLRSLHHGTCLLESANLSRISPLLRSPAEAFIKARGVESVRSPVRNVGVGYDDFVRAVSDEFQRMYGPVAGGGLVVSGGGDGTRLPPDVYSGIEELQSREWIFGQTPLFTFSTHPTADDPRPRPPLPDFLPANFQATITARHGQIQETHLRGLSPLSETGTDQAVSDALVGRIIHQVDDWRAVLGEAGAGSTESEAAGRWLNELFGVDV